MAGMPRCTPTQPTQRSYDSGSGDAALADVLCILHPCSPAAFSIVEATASTAPHHVLQDVTASHYNDGFSQAELEEQETFLVNGEDRPESLDLALRFSSPKINPAMGFIFGRNSQCCDITIGTDTVKRVSNIHFRIFVNQSGVCMLEDLSTNGTVVDKVILKGKGSLVPATRMLNAGSIIELLSPKADEVVKFILRIPSRENHMEEFADRFTVYMQEIALAEAYQGKRELHRPAVKAAYPRLAATGNLPMVRPPLVQNTWGMHWNGGDMYNVVGHLGKGAFATVYRLATKADGQLYAAKELEKRRFMKNGILDRKLDNELQIMRDIDHPHVVQYVDYQDIANHLYIIMEYVPCGDLQQWLIARGPLSEMLANTVAEQIFDALAYLHRKMITHRDIKPDNILISNDNIDNFSIKLSDFGLSKVVKDNDTFLKTFCGTLLYCAPEVFPHYDTFLAANGKGANKRKLRKGTPPRQRYHMYSQSVDIWSLGGVLWYAMCLKPPFEGVADATGKGMFERIMTTQLDPTPLLKHGISHAAIDLLGQMLRTDPAERPTPEKCLMHHWFDRHTEDECSLSSSPGLGTIDEEDDEYFDNEDEDENSDEDGQKNESDEGAAPDFSQLSLHDGRKQFEERRAEASNGSSDLELADPRQSKRFKLDPVTYGHAASKPSGPLPHPLRPNVAATDPGIYALATQAQPTRPLYGEVQPSYLKSSGVFGMRGTERFPQPEVYSTSSSAYASSKQAREQLFYGGGYGGDTEESVPDAAEEQNDAYHISSYLLGADTHLRDLNMGSPVESADSPNAELNEPQTPRTPENAPQASFGQASTEETPKPAEATPTEPKYSRQISLPISASFFYNPNDPSTHNPEYASCISGYDFTSRAAMPGESFHSLPPTEHNISPSSSTASEIAAPPQALEPEFARPAPRLGRLTTSTRSFANIVLNLSTRVASWGRTPGNTFVYPLRNDTRVPKVAIVLYFHANGIEDVEKSGEDWTKLPGLHCLISTESSLGIRVNGVKLTAKDKEGRRLYGRVHTGDVLTICSGANTLEFECAFNHGEGKEKRKDGEKFHINREEAGVNASKRS